MADGIILERLGVQAASIITSAFTRSSDAMAGTMGAHGYRYAMIPHPLSSLTPEECRTRAGEVLAEVLAILGLEGAGAAVTPAEATDGDGRHAAGPAPAPELTVERVKDLQRVIEHYFEQGWTDGLPVVPVTEDTVREFVEFAGRDPGEKVAVVEHLGRACTVELAAIAAAMAGCRKEYFPVVLAAVEALRPNIATGLLQSTTGQAQLIIVNGPIRTRLGFNAAGNVFGPGSRANATVGRAFRLIVMNVFGIRPGELDQATQGTPAKYSFCIAENEEESPWEPLHVERGFAREADVVTAHFARSTLHVENRISNRPEDILLTIADSMSYAGSWQAGRGYTVVMGPEHAQLIARHGWTKQDVKRFLWEHWGRRKSDLRRFGLYREDVVRDDPLSGGASAVAGNADEFIRFGESPDSILLVVAGANNAGVSTVVPMVRPLFPSQVVRTP
ncbi:MAG TPA: hypothetical protein VFD49_13960 [Candidatus Dormibacteraeota bacterium]|nr:hypothetical protein [Candidatus Dormibacteraeota bacterium]